MNTEGEVSLLREEVADEAALIFVVDACEEFGAELLYCLWAIKGQLLILCAAAEVAWHAPGLKYGLDLSVEIHPRIRIAGFGCRI